jgi:hypothetical protein
MGSDPAFVQHSTYVRIWLLGTPQFAKKLSAMKRINKMLFATNTSRFTALEYIRYSIIVLFAGGHN